MMADTWGRRAIGSLAAVAIISAISPASAADRSKQALLALAASLDAPPVLRAEFRQARKARALAQPIVSTGRMVAAARHGILWQVAAPFPMTVVMTPSRVTEREEGSPPRVVPLLVQPSFQTFMNLFLDLPAGRLEHLSDSFTTAVTRKGRRWQLRLTPKQRPLAAAIAAIEVRGQTYIETVVVQERGGDTTTITFSGQRPDPAGLTLGERRSFYD